MGHPPVTDKLSDHGPYVAAGWKRAAAEAHAAARCGSAAGSSRRSGALVMAIVNRTPDSFYRPGVTWDEDAALERRARDRGRGRGPPRRRRGARQARPRGDGDGGDPPDRPVHRAGPGGLPRSGDQRGHLAARAGQGGLRRPAPTCSTTPGRPGTRRSPTWRPSSASAWSARTSGVALPRTRPHRAAFGDVVADVLDRVLLLAGRALAAGWRPTGSSSTRRTTSARTPGTRSRSPGGSAS